MTEEESLPERVRRKYESLSESQRKIARYCISQTESAGSLTALRIADELGVSESTVVRFAAKMGYRGFPDMQASLRSAARAQSQVSRPKGRGRIDGRAQVSLRNDLEALEQSIASLNLNTLAAAAEALDKAKNLYVCGFRTSFSLAHLAEFHIRHIHPSARLLGDIGGTLVDDLELIEPGDAVLAFTFPIYDDRTIATIDRATEVGAASVVFTDSALAPIPVHELVHPLTIRHDSRSFFNSNVAATAVLNALVVRLVELRSIDQPDFERRLAERFHLMRGRKL